jgi:hypothetical protein
MAYLQLAENNPYTALAENNPMTNYLFVPAGVLGMLEDTYLRSDFFDSLPNDEFSATMSILAPYQNTGMSAIGTAVGLGSKLIQKIAQNRKDKKEAGIEVKPIFKGKEGGLIDKIKKAIEKNKTKPDATDQQTKSLDLPNIQLDGSINGAELQIGLNPPTFFTKYKTPLLIAGGLVGAFAIYKLATKKTTRKK